MDDLSAVEVCKNDLAVGVIFGVGLPSAVRFDEFLDIIVPVGNDTPTFLNDTVFGMDFFKQMSYLGGKIGN